jgi:hypothetical protein
MQAQRVCHDTLPWLISFSLDLMSIRQPNVLMATVLLASCAAEPTARTGVFQPHFIGNVQSISSADKRTILELQRDAILKEFRALPNSITVRVINHNYVMVFYEVRNHQCGDPVQRVKGKWTRPPGPRVTVAGLTNRWSQPLFGVACRCRS